MAHCLTSGIPIVDLGLNPGSGCRTVGDPHKLGAEIVNAFSTQGFVYLMNHAISQDQIDGINRICRNFFSLENNVKKNFPRKVEENSGWVKIGDETFTRERPDDIRECYNVCPSKIKTWPDPVCPEFRSTMDSFVSECDRLTHIVLKLMATGLKLKNAEYFTERHKLRTKENSTTLRLLYYPEIKSTKEILPKQIRCGEHTDYGSITLLFQDSVGGLEVMNREGVYVPATPIQGSVLVNIGDLMQRWTEDVLISTHHRVLFPEERESVRAARQSIAYFVHPDDDCMVEAIEDGHSKYEPITALDYLKLKFKQTY